jgi:hypothetical protein
MKYVVIYLHDHLPCGVGKIALFSKLWFEGRVVGLANVCNVDWQLKNKKCGSAGVVGSHEE